MDFERWIVGNAIYIKNFQMISINNLIPQETGG